MRDIPLQSHFRCELTKIWKDKICVYYLQGDFLEGERSPQTTCFSGVSTSEIMSHLDHSYSSAVSFKQASAVWSPNTPVGKRRIREWKMKWWWCRGQRRMDKCTDLGLWACGWNRQAHISPLRIPPLKPWPSQNPFHHWCIRVIKKHQCLFASRIWTHRHSIMPPAAFVHLFHSNLQERFFPGGTFVVMDERRASFWQACSWCHIITVSPFRQNYQIIPTPRRHGCDWQVRPTKETQILQIGGGESIQTYTENYSRQLTKLSRSISLWQFWWLLSNYVQ